MKDQKLLTQQNNFYSRLLDGTLLLHSTEIALYNALLDKSNRVAMKKFGTFKTDFRFPASEQELNKTAGISHKTLLKSREILKQVQLINYYPGKRFGNSVRNPAAEYLIIFLPFHKFQKQAGSRKKAAPLSDTLGQIYPSTIGQNYTSDEVQNCPSKTGSTSAFLPSNIDTLDYLYRGENTHISIAPEVIELIEQFRDLPEKWLSDLDNRRITLTESAMDIHLTKMAASVRRRGYEQTSALIDTAIERRYTSINYDQLASESGQDRTALTVPDEMIIDDY